MTNEKILSKIFYELVNLNNLEASTGYANWPLISNGNKYSIPGLPEFFVKNFKCQYLKQISFYYILHGSTSIPETARKNHQ
jgi:hypothetical protein